MVRVVPGARRLRGWFVVEGGGIVSAYGDWIVRYPQSRI